MTVMFCDLVDSTRLAEQLDPEDLRDVIVAFQAACAGQIEPLDGYIAKYMGDGLLAYFGYPMAHEDDALRAVHAGLGIVDSLRVLNEDLVRRFDLTVRCRVGIHSGLVVAGQMGAGHTLEEFAIVGETPNIAARIESVAAPDSVAVSDATHRLVAGFFEVEALGSIPLRGVTRPVEVSRVLHPTGAVNRIDAEQGQLTPLVGREKELAQLVEVWQRAVAGNGGLAHLSGPAGIGKSRLTRALHDRLVDSDHTLHVWECTDHHRDTALHPIIKFLETWSGLDREAPAGDQLAILETAMAGVELDSSTAGPLLARLLSIPLEQPDAPALEPINTRAATLDVLEQLLVANSKQHPLLIVVEDLHWAGPTTLDFLSRIVAAVADLPVMAVFTFRPDFSPPWADETDIVDVRLVPLNSDEVAEMINSANYDLDIPPAVAARVVELADGVPLFVDEMLKMLDGAIRRPSTEYGAVDKSVERLTVPDTLQGLLTARLDRLSEVRDVIQCAAVLGRHFQLNLLEAISPLNKTELSEAVGRLVDEGVVRRTGPSGDRYEFRHALLHEAAYRSLLKRQRTIHHLASARAIVRLFPDLVDREPDVVAYHLTEAGRHAEAVPYWRAAGLQAMNSAAFLEAASHFRKGIATISLVSSSADTDPDRAFLISHLAASIQAGLGYAADGVAELYEDARRISERAHDDDLFLSVIRGLWMCRLLRAEYPAALKLADEMLRWGDRLDNAGARVAGCLHIGMTHLFQGDLVPARSRLEAAIELYEPDQNEGYIFTALGDSGAGAMAYLAMLLFRLGEVDRSMKLSDESIRLAEAVGSPMSMAQAWGMRALLHLARKEPIEMAEWADKTLRFAKARNITYWSKHASLLNLWLEARATGMVDGAAKYRDELKSHTSTGAKLGLPDFTMLLADLCRAERDPQLGILELSAAELHITQTGELMSQSDVLRTKAELLMSYDQPDFNAAEAALRQAIEIARPVDSRIAELRALAVLTKLRTRNNGDVTEPLAELRRLCEWFPRDADFRDIVEARRLTVMSVDR